MSRYLSVPAPPRLTCGGASPGAGGGRGCNGGSPAALHPRRSTVRVPIHVAQPESSKPPLARNCKQACPLLARDRRSGSLWWVTGSARWSRGRPRTQPALPAGGRRATPHSTVPASSPARSGLVAAGVRLRLPSKCRGGGSGQFKFLCAYSGLGPGVAQ